MTSEKNKCVLRNILTKALFYTTVKYRFLPFWHCRLSNFLETITGLTGRKKVQPCWGSDRSWWSVSRRPGHCMMGPRWAQRHCSDVWPWPPLMGLRSSKFVVVFPCAQGLATCSLLRECGGSRRFVSAQKSGTVRESVCAHAYVCMCACARIPRKAIW